MYFSLAFLNIYALCRGKMADLKKYSLSISPEIILVQFVQDLEKLISSSQKSLNIIKSNTDAQKQDLDNMAIAFLQDIGLLVEFHFTIKNYVDELIANIQDDTDEESNDSENPSVEILKSFAHEARHPISSIRGLITITQSSIDPSLQLETLQNFDGVLQTMRNIHSKLLDLLSME